MNVDWRALMVKYAQAVICSDWIFGIRCLQGEDWGPHGLSPEEIEALERVRKEVWPEDMLGPYDKDKKL